MKIQLKDQIYFFKDQQIVRFESKQEQTIMFLNIGEYKILDTDINDIEKQLVLTSFIRVHSDHIINGDFISKIPDSNANAIVMEDGTEIPSEDETITKIIKFLENHINP